MAASVLQTFTWFQSLRAGGRDCGFLNTINVCWENGEVIAFHTNPLLPLTLTETLRLWRETTLCCVLTRTELCSRRPRRCKHGDLPPTLIGRDPGGRGKQRDVLFVRDEFMTESEQRLCGGTVSWRASKVRDLWVYWFIPCELSAQHSTQSLSLQYLIIIVHYQVKQQFLSGLNSWAFISLYLKVESKFTRKAGMRKWPTDFCFWVDEIVFSLLILPLHLVYVKSLQNNELRNDHLWGDKWSQGETAGEYIYI